MLPSNIWIFEDSYAFCWQQVFHKKLVNTFLGCFAMQTQGASGYKPVGETLFLFIILFFAVLQHNFTKWGLYICIDLDIAHIGSWLFKHNKDLFILLLCGFVFYFAFHADASNFLNIFLDILNSLSLPVPLFLSFCLFSPLQFLIIN